MVQTAKAQFLNWQNVENIGGNDGPNCYYFLIKTEQNVKFEKFSRKLLFNIEPSKS